MTLSSNLQAFASRVGKELKSLREDVDRRISNGITDMNMKTVQSGQVNSDGVLSFNLRDNTIIPVSGKLVGSQSQSSGSTYTITGTGRPDNTSTTGGKITGSEAVGTRYVSTDRGGGTGADEWTKYANGWVITKGDTGWRKVSTTALTKGWIAYRRTEAACFISLTGGDYGSVTTKDKLTNTKQTITSAVPSGWMSPVAIIGDVTNDALDRVATLTLLASSDSGGIQIRVPSATTSASNALLRPSVLVYLTDDAWPTTLPGSAA